MDNVEWSYSQVVGHPSEKRWSQVLVFPQSHVKLSQEASGVLWVVFSVSADSAADEVGAGFVTKMEACFGQGLPTSSKDSLMQLKEIASSYDIVLSAMLVMEGRTTLLAWNGGADSSFAQLDCGCFDRCSFW